jgi:hypothetical protein
LPAKGNETHDSLIAHHEFSSGERVIGCAPGQGEFELPLYIPVHVGRLRKIGLKHSEKPQSSIGPPVEYAQQAEEEGD